MTFPGARVVASVGSGRKLGVGLMMMSLTSMQIGNAFAKRLTEQMATPIGAVWMRLAFSGVILLGMALVRHLVRRATRRYNDEPDGGLTAQAAPRPSRQAWLFAIAYGAAIIAMNSLFYEAIARIPVGIVITIEFFGPLAVAVLGSHHAIDLMWVGLAGLGVAILGFTPTKLSTAGVLLSIGAGVCWAGYILLGSRVAQHWEGVGVLTGACVAGGIVLAPAFVISGNTANVSWGTIGLGLTVALACTVLPYSLELAALKRLSTGLFAIMESLAPAMGALAAWWILGQALHWGDWVAVGCVVVAALGASGTIALRARRDRLRETL